MTDQNSADTTGNDEYVNFIAEGLAYVNSVREVNPKRARYPSTSVRMAVMHGRKGDLEYTRADFSCRGRQACELIKQYWDVINEQGADGKQKNKVVVRFRAGDFWINTWTYQNKQYSCLKGRLLMITYLSINGEVVYHEPGGPASDQCNSPLPGEVEAGDQQGGEAAQVADIVQLTKDDPDFDATKAQLKGGGYRFFKRFHHDETDFENVWVKFAA